MKPRIFTMPEAGWSSRLIGRLGSCRALGRGLLVCVTIALATTFIADHYGGPTLLYALLFGMSLHFLSEEGPCRQGIEFAARTVLRLGVARKENSMYGQKMKLSIS